MHCGRAHPDHLLAGLTVRQMLEIEWYAGLEPISWDIGVSQPPETKKETKTRSDVEKKLDAILTPFEK